MVKIVRDGDPAGSNAVSARATLGPDWKEAVDSKNTDLPVITILVGKSHPQTPVKPHNGFLSHLNITY